MTDSPKRILIVEDDPDIRTDLSELLKEIGYQVTTAENGQDALGKLSVMGRPCLILLDLMMPVMNGWEFRGAMSKIPALQAVPVVILSGVANPAQEAAALNASAFLAKPFGLEALLELVGRYC